MTRRLNRLNAQYYIVHLLFFSTGKFSGGWSGGVECDSLPQITKHTGQLRLVILWLVNGIDECAVGSLSTSSWELRAYQVRDV